MLTNGLDYGADYNPEQWDEPYQDDDIRLMTEAGVTVVTVGVFSWAVLETEPGVFNFEWLRRVLDRLHEAGIGVDLATATASPPAWLGRLFPSTLPVTKDGVALAWGSRQQANPNSEVYCARVGELVRRMAHEFAHHPAVVAWHVGNEFGCHVHESFDEESAARFRDWLQARYGSLEALNEAWGTAFWSQAVYSWLDVQPPRATPSIPNPHHLADWREFCSDSLLELFLIERDILRAANPRIPITTNFMGLFAPVDYWKWAQYVDFVSNDSYPDPANPRAAREFAFDCDLMRSLGRGRPFVQMEQVTSAVQWRPRNAVKRPGQYHLWSLAAVARGADAVMNFQWRQSRAGAEAFHGAMVEHAGTDAPVWPEVTALGAELKALDALRGTTLTAQIAILWDWQNAWTYDSAAGPTDESAPENEARAWHASLFELGHLVDFARPSDDLSSYRVIIVPSMFRLERAAATRIRDAAERGAQVLVTYLTGYMDESGHVILGGYLGALADLVGVRVVGISPRAVEPFAWGKPEPVTPEADRISAVVGTPAAATAVPLLDGDGRAWNGQGRGWAEHVIVEDPSVSVIAVFDAPDVAGEPAITVRRSESSAGSAWYVATDLDARARSALLAGILAEAGIESHELPLGIEHRRRGGVDFYLNHGDSPVCLAIAGPDGTPTRIAVPPRSARLVPFATSVDTGNDPTAHTTASV